VNRRRSIVCVVAACLAVEVAAGCAAKKPPEKVPEPPSAPDWQGDPCTQERLDRFIAQYGVRGCKIGVHPEEGLLRGVLHHDLWHFRVAYVGELDSGHRKAFQDGMAMWNRHRYVTGFAFEDATSTKDVDSTTDVDFRYIAGLPPVPPDAKKGETVEKTSCAGFGPAGSYVWYSLTNSKWANDPGAARIYAHELGHGLNLDHQQALGVPSVMREGDTGSDCRILAKDVLADIQSSDAINAFICGCGIRLKPRKEGPKPVSDRK
jgi:hypothetical protein